MKLSLLPLLALTVGMLANGCASESDDEGDGLVASEASDDPYASGGNSEMGALCKSLPGLIVDVSGRDAAYPFFRWNSSVDHALDVVVAALDTNHDGVVTNLDKDVDLNVIGFSWGGFNARDLSRSMASDRRFSPSRRDVARLITLDPYRTDVGFERDSIMVPANVSIFYEFRHTIAPEKDCSRIVEGLIGPFTGRDPRCTGDSVCHDFDYSLTPTGANVDHCAVPSRATRSVRQIVGGLRPTNLPPERIVERY
jgi:hypothetical protein